MQQAYNGPILSSYIMYAKVCTIIAVLAFPVFTGHYIYKKRDFSTLDQGFLSRGELTFQQPIRRAYHKTSLPYTPPKLNKIQLSAKRRNLLCDANSFAPVVKIWLKFHLTARYRGRDVEYESSFMHVLQYDTVAVAQATMLILNIST